MSLEKISSLLIDAKKIGITYHVSPDGDAVGSVLALLSALRLLNKDAYVISKDKVPTNLAFLPLSNEITGDIMEPTKDTDVVIVLDCGNFERICADLNDYKKTILNVDHHISNDMYGSENYVDTTASATAEIVFELIKLLGVSFTTNSNEILGISTCLYTSLITDTGAFRHSNVTERTLSIAARLRGLGVNNTYLYEMLFENKEFNRILLLGKALSNIELALDGKVAVIAITKALLSEIGMEAAETSDIISYGLQIIGVEVSVLIKETDTGVKCSLRSKNKVDVRNVAEKFGGGGHVKAAGIGVNNITVNEFKYELLKEIEKGLEV